MNAQIASTLKDWQYEKTNSFEITVELGCYKYPTDEMIAKLWSDHVYSLLSYAELVQEGVKVSRRCFE